VAQILQTADLDDFHTLEVHNHKVDSKLGASALLSGVCTLDGLPCASSRFLVRIACGQAATAMRSETRALARTPPHAFIARRMAAHATIIPSVVSEAIIAALGQEAHGSPLASPGTPVFMCVSPQLPNTLETHGEIMPKPLPFPTWMQLAVDLGSALYHLHSNGIAHCALHPQCVGLTPAAAPVLGDFQCALATKDSAGGSSHWQLISPDIARLPAEASGFAAPEVRHLFKAGATDMSAAPAADMWSMGALLLFAATGDEPMRGYSASQSFEMDEAAISPLPSTYPAGARSMIKWLMNKDPTQRISAGSALKRFAKLSNGMVPTGQPPIPGVAPPLHSLAPSRALTALVRGLPAGGSAYAPVPAGMDASTRGASGGTLTGMIAVRTLAGGSTIVRFAPGAKVKDVLVTAADTLRVASSLASCGLVVDGRVLDLNEDIVCAVPSAEQTMHTGAALIDASALPCVFMMTHMPSDALRAMGAAEVADGASISMAAVTVHQPSVLSLAALGGVASAPLGLQLGLAAGALPNAAALARAVSSGAAANPPGLPAMEDERAGDEGMPGMQDAGGAAGRFASGSGVTGAAAGGAQGGNSLDDEEFKYGVLTSAGYVFDPRDKNRHVDLSGNNTVAECTGKWASVALRMKSVDAGRLVFTVRLLSAESGCGFAIGVACVDGPNPFDPKSHSLGAHVSSYAYSKTGKKGGGPREGFTSYGSPMVTGDVITCDADLSRGVVRFYRNGMDQGVAFDAGIMGRRMLPVVCLGSNNGGKLTRVELLNPTPMAFDSGRSHQRMTVASNTNGLRNLSNKRKWATALCAHNGLVRGKVEWSVRLTDVQSGGGVALGVVDASSFDWKTSNLGASEQSWGYSKTGKKGDGKGFQDFGMPFTNGDVVTTIVDMDLGTLAFRVNGIDQGIAYGPGAEDYGPDNPGLKGRCVVPAVCLGSSEGDKDCKVSLCDWQRHFEVPTFDALRCKPTTNISERGRMADTTGKWGTVFVAGNPIQSGTYTVGVQIVSAEQGCGAAVGVADVLGFKPTTANLGASENSWAYSKTGKASCGRRFVTYGTPFANDDIVTVDIDMDEQTIEFYLNGASQGVLQKNGLERRALVPAVCIGNTEGGLYTAVRAVPPAVIRFDPGRRSNSISLKYNNREAETLSKWSSVFALHPGQMSGVLRFAVEVKGSGGAAVGVADANHFKPQYQNVGAADHSWALSKSGKVSCGEGWQTYAGKLESGDVVGVELDFNAGTLTFYKNGENLGVAFSNLDGRGYLMLPAICLGSNYGERESSATLLPLLWDESTREVKFPPRRAAAQRGGAGAWQ